MKRIPFAVIGLLTMALIALGASRADAQSCNDCPPPKAKLCESVWLRGEYLLWQTSGMKLPPLVTANPLGTDPAEAGVIGVPSTHILAGNNTIFDDARSGIRVFGGVEFCGGVGVEADYFILEDETANYHFDSSSNLILGRPFINLAPLAGPVRWDTQLINFPPDLTGAVNVHAFSKFQGAGARLRFNVFTREKCVYDVTCDEGCDDACGSPCDSMIGCAPRKVKCSAFDLTLGYRYLDLDEGILIRERVFSTVDEFALYDQFDASSRFNGLEVGVDYACFHSRYGFNFYSRLGVGANNNKVRIAGQTAIDGVPQIEPGGILAQASNIGSHNHTVASLTAQIGLNANVCLAKCLYANAGYSFLYWGNVVRAGEQIDKKVHPGLFPPYTAPPGTIGALPTHKTSNFYAHGLNLGLTFVH